LFENTAPRRISEPKLEVTRGLRKLKELHNLYSSADIIRMVKSEEGKMGHVAYMREMRNAYIIWT
jgi:hypothetical protein